MKFTERLSHAWNAFLSREPTRDQYQPYGYVSSTNPVRPRFTKGSDRSIITSVYNRIAVDTAAIGLSHVRLDENKRYSETIPSGLNECLSLRANIDQTARAFMQDVVMSMFDEGCVAIVPVDTTLSPYVTGGYDINSLRCGRITAWYPQHVRVKLYNELVGRHDEVTLPKKMVCIIENPFYAIMNEPNSTSQRLIRKLALLDYLDEQNSSGKLDLIIQLPYAVKDEARQKAAEKRRQSLTDQLVGSRYGIAYADVTEKITQLNRPVENNLFTQIEALQKQLYAHLGITEGILNGTASDAEYLNYYNHTIEPILSEITTEMMSKFLTPTARTKNHSIFYCRDPFKLAPVEQLAELADKLTRNEIMTSNEFRQIIGLKPSNDPGADELRNKNLNQNNATPQPEGEESADPMGMPMS